MFFLNGNGKAMVTNWVPIGVVACRLGEMVQLAELGTSLFEIAQSLFALERTFILGAMALLETKSKAQ